MKGLLSNQAILFLLILTPALLMGASLLGRLYPVHLAPQIPFFFDLLEIHRSLPLYAVYFLGLMIFLLIWLISKKIFIKDYWLVPLICSISPWFAYLTFAGSFYIYLLFLILAAFYGVLLLRSGRTILGAFVFISGSLLGLYSSLLLVVIFPLVILGCILSKFVTFKTIKLSLIIITVFCLPLFGASVKNQIGFKNIYRNEITIFSDPGLISSVNALQGESRKSGLSLFTKLSENKYIYLFQYTILKVLKHAVPSTYFTQQEKLLRFSFSPPVFAALLVPFLYGLFSIIKLDSLRKYLWWLLIFAIPSLLAKSLIDLNRLILFGPVIIFVTSFGLRELAKQKSKISKIVRYLIILLVVLQFVITLLDINLREYPRYERFFGGKFEIQM